MYHNGVTRREFLKIAGASSLAVTLPLNHGCFVRQNVSVSMVKHSDDTYALKRAVQLAGDFQFLNPGDSVLLKVALNFSDPFPATTSPDLVSNLITLLKDKGASEIIVGDLSPMWQDTMNCLQKTGIYDAALNAGARVIVFDDADMVKVQPELAVHWPAGFSMPGIFSEVDHIISLPTLRAHRLAGFTMSIKNFVGALPQDERFVMHDSSDLLDMIAEIPLGTNKIRFTVLDGREGWSMVKPGIEGGTLIEPGIIIASSSLVGADAVGVALLKSFNTTTDLMETRIWEHPIIKRGVEVSSPPISFDTLELLSEGIENIDEIKGYLLN